MDSTEDMRPPHGCSLGVDEEGEKQPEEKPTGISVVRAGGKEEKGTQTEPEQGAAAPEEREMGAEEDAQEGRDSGPGASGPRGDENHEASGDSGREPGEQAQEQEPVQASAEYPPPGHRQQGAQRGWFTAEQREELERIFYHTAFPSLALRQELSRVMNVPEARVRAWFKKRRAQWRRQQRALLFRNTYPMAQAPPVVISSVTPFNAVLLPQPVWVCFPVPLPVWVTLLPMPPFPLPLLPSPPLVLAPLPPWGPQPRGWAWFLTWNGPFLAPIF